jgi:ATP-dependent Clp protease ATP-binding subunit ClpB
VGTFLSLEHGVGKTELAKALAEYLFDDEMQWPVLIWANTKNAQRKPLSGCASGYVGYDEGGQLTEAVRRKPYSVIYWMKLKKHILTFNILLQVLDEGRLTDNKDV